MQGKYPTFYINLSLFQPNFNGKLQTINISDIYVSIDIMCHQFIELIISGSNMQHSMLGFHKKNRSMKKQIPRNIDNIYVSILGKYIQVLHMVYIWMIQPTMDW